MTRKQVHDDSVCVIQEVSTAAQQANAAKPQDGSLPTSPSGWDTFDFQLAKSSSSRSPKPKAVERIPWRRD